MNGGVVARAKKDLCSRHVRKGRVVTVVVELDGNAISGVDGGAVWASNVVISRYESRKNENKQEQC